MAQADLMTYDDDFDSEDERDRGRNKYGVQVQHGKKGKKVSSASAKKELKDSAKKVGEPKFDEISHIAEEEEDDDDIDLLAKFVEGADSELIKDHSNII